MTKECVEHKQKYAYGHTNGKRLHRLAYCEANGVSYESIKGWHVLHSCDNPRCVNPAHLRLGTHQDNMDDKRIRQRAGRGTAKIDFATAELIRAEYAAGGYTQRELATRHGIGQYVISRVVNNKMWTYA